MVSGLIVADLVSADVGIFDHAEKMNAAAQATMRTVRMGSLLYRGSGG
jgi:hypothetical protein